MQVTVPLTPVEGNQSRPNACALSPYGPLGGSRDKRSRSNAAFQRGD